MVFRLWSESGRRTWPRLPGGRIFLAQAIDLIGRQLYGDAWKVTDPDTSLPVPEAKPSFNPRPAPPPLSLASPNWETRPQLSADEHLQQQRRIYDDLCAAIDKRNSENLTIAALSQAASMRAAYVNIAVKTTASDQRLRTLYHSPRDGETQAISSSFWTIKSAFETLQSCHVNDKPWMREIDHGLKCPVFVIESDLRAIDWRAIRWGGEPAPLDSSPSITAPIGETNGRRRGRRPKWDWNGLTAEIVRIADQDGLGTIAISQAGLEGWAADWFAARHTGASPSESLIRSHIAPIYQRIDDHNRDKAGN